MVFWAPSYFLYTCYPWGKHKIDFCWNINEMKLYIDACFHLLQSCKALYSRSFNLIIELSLMTK